MAIHFRRSGGMKPPPDRENLQIEDDGSFSLWRSVGWTTSPPTAAGRFEGRLEAAERQKLDKLVKAAAKGDNLQMKVKPDGAIDRLQLGQKSAVLGANDDADEPWYALVELLRELLGDLTRAPKAAVALKVAPDGQSAHLVHQGQEALRLDLSNLTVRAVLWEGYLNQGDWRAKEAAGASAPVTAGPGWSLELPFDHHHDLNDKREVIAYATFTIFDGTTPVPVSLSSGRLKPV